MFSRVYLFTGGGPPIPLNYGIQSHEGQKDPPIMFACKMETEGMDLSLIGESKGAPGDTCPPGNAIFFVILQSLRKLRQILDCSAAFVVGTLPPPPQTK